MSTCPRVTTIESKLSVSFSMDILLCSSILTCDRESSKISQNDATPLDNASPSFSRVPAEALDSRPARVRFTVSPSISNIDIVRASISPLPHAIIINASNIISIGVIKRLFRFFILLLIPPQINLGYILHRFSIIVV
jgi:hypothetical protein